MCVLLRRVLRTYPQHRGIAPSCQGGSTLSAGALVEAGFLQRESTGWAPANCQHRITVWRQRCRHPRTLGALVLTSIPPPLLSPTPRFEVTPEIQRLRLGVLTHARDEGQL